MKRKQALELLLFGTERPGIGGGLENLRPLIEKLSVLSEDERVAVFEGNARHVYSRLHG